MESLEWMFDNWESLTAISILGLIGIFALILYATWCFIASAVKKGVKDALSETPIKTIPYSYYIGYGVKEGVLSAMKEMDIIEIKYHDNNNRDVYFKKDVFNDLNMGFVKDYNTVE